MFLLDAAIWLAQNLWALALHLSGKSSFPKPLPPEEEAKYLDAMLQGDGRARSMLIEHNLRLVAHIAKKYASSGVEMDDLVSIGSIGLMKAVNTFRPEAGKLTTYASRCIENEILMYLRANRKNKANVGLGEPIGMDKEGNEICLLDLLGTDKDAVPDEAETHIESARAVERLDRVLSEREHRVIELRYGLQSGEPMHQHLVARELGISRSYVSRIEKKALEKLRKSMEEQRIREKGD